MSSVRENLIAQLTELHASMSAAPWSEAALYAGIRHIHRNTDVMEDAQEYADEPDKSANLPNRYDGTPLARLRNLLPEIIAELSASPSMQENDRG